MGPERGAFHDRLRLNYWGYSEGDPSIRVERHVHDFHQMNFGLGGVCVIETPQGRRLLRGGELVLITPGVEHALSYPERFLGFCCKFHLTMQGLPRVHHVPAGPFSRGVIQAAKGIMEATFPREFFGNPRGAIVMPGDRYQVLMESFLAGLLTLFQRRILQERIPERIAAAWRRRPEDFYSVAEAAAASGYSRNQFGRVIRKATGVTAREFLAHLKLRQAAHLLKDTDLTLREIAGRLGFSSQFHFSDFFRRSTGTSPARFRMGTDE